MEKILITVIPLLCMWVAYLAVRINDVQNELNAQAQINQTVMRMLLDQQAFAKELNELSKSALKSRNSIVAMLEKYREITNQEEGTVLLTSSEKT